MYGIVHVHYAVLYCFASIIHPKIEPLNYFYQECIPGFTYTITILSERKLKVRSPIVEVFVDLAHSHWFSPKNILL